MKPKAGRAGGRRKGWRPCCQCGSRLLDPVLASEFPAKGTCLAQRPFSSQGNDLLGLDPPGWCSVLCLWGLFLSRKKQGWSSGHICSGLPASAGASLGSYPPQWPWGLHSPTAGPHAAHCQKVLSTSPDVTPQSSRDAAKPLLGCCEVPELHSQTFKHSSSV